MGIEEIFIDLTEYDDLCIYTVIVKNELSFGQLDHTHKLYDCTICEGSPGSCPNYASYKSLYEKQYTKFREDINGV